MSIGRDVGFLYLLPPPPPNQESKQEEVKSGDNFYLIGLIERLRIEKSGEEVGEPNRKKQRVASSKTPSSSSSSFMDSILGGMNDIHQTTRRSQQQNQGSNSSSHPMSISTSSQTFSSPPEQMGGVLEEDLRFKQEVIDTIHSFLQGLSTDITFDIVNRLDGALMFLEITRKMYCIFCSKEVCDDYEDSIVVVSSKDDVGVKFEEQLTLYKKGFEPEEDEYEKLKKNASSIEFLTSKPRGGSNRRSKMEREVDAADIKEMLTKVDFRAKDRRTATQAWEDVQNSSRKSSKSKIG